MGKTFRKGSGHNKFNRRNLAEQQKFSKKFHTKKLHKKIEPILPVGTEARGDFWPDDLNIVEARGDEQ